MELPSDLKKLKLKVLHCSDCAMLDTRGKPYCYLRKELIDPKRKACDKISVKEK